MDSAFHINPLEILLMHIVTQWVQREVWDSAFLTSSQVTPTLLLHGPHFEWQGTRAGPGRGWRQVYLSWIGLKLRHPPGSGPLFFSGEREDTPGLTRPRHIPSPRSSKRAGFPLVQALFWGSKVPRKSHVARLTPGLPVFQGGSDPAHSSLEAPNINSVQGPATFLRSCPSSPQARLLGHLALILALTSSCVGTCLISSHCYFPGGGLNAECWPKWHCPGQRMGIHLFNKHVGFPGNLDSKTIYYRNKREQTLITSWCTYNCIHRKKSLQG